MNYSYMIIEPNQFRIFTHTGRRHKYSITDHTGSAYIFCVYLCGACSMSMKVRYTWIWLMHSAFILCSKITCDQKLKVIIICSNNLNFYLIVIIDIVFNNLLLSYFFISISEWSHVDSAGSVVALNAYMNYKKKKKIFYISYGIMNVVLFHVISIWYVQLVAQI